MIRGNLQTTFVFCFFVAGFLSTNIVWPFILDAKNVVSVPVVGWLQEWEWAISETFPAYRKLNVQVELWDRKSVYCRWRRTRCWTRPLRRTWTLWKTSALRWANIRRVLLTRVTHGTADFGFSCTTCRKEKAEGTAVSPSASSLWRRRPLGHGQLQWPDAVSKGCVSAVIVVAVISNFRRRVLIGCGFPNHTGLSPLSVSVSLCEGMWGL